MTEDYNNFVEPMDVEQDGAADSNKTLKIIGIIILVLVVLCVCLVVFILLLPVILTAILALLSPFIGDVFSDIIIGI
ncbi:MAG: hypothetical protein FVQ83_05295 [Chloroflexi bacterium]|nr:hypothetical protein [Chloroflexota bacterium]